MNKMETTQVLAMLNVQYHYFHDDEAANAVTVWLDLLKDEEIRLVAPAVKQYMKDDVYNRFPTTGQILAIVKEYKRKEAINRDISSSQLPDIPKVWTKEEMEKKEALIEDCFRILRGGRL